jgi:type IV pilus assembly protein PilW
LKIKNHIIKAGATMTNKRGFTLVELMVAMAISLLVIGSIYSVYRSQQKSYLVQEQVAAMQQNLRAGMTMLTRDIRMAGYNPPSSTLASAGITEPLNSTDITFTRWDDGDAEGKTIIYSISGSDLVRDSGAGPQPVAENIDALNFVYLDATGTETTTADNVRSIQVTMVARTGRADPGYTNDEVFYNQQGDPVFPSDGNPPNDSIRRLSFSRQIKCRNLGLGG